MKHIRFDIETDGFYGAYWACKTPSNYAMNAMIGADPEDHMARSCVKWFLKQGINVLTMSPGKKDYGHHNYPLERVETAISWLKTHGIHKVGIVGASTTGTLALMAASYFADITLTIGMTPSDFIWQGVMQGKKDGCKEWPNEGESLVSYGGKPLPLYAFCLSAPTVLAERPHTCEVETVVYPYATHFVFPEGLMKVILPVGSSLFVKMAFQSAKKHPKECKSARVDIDRRITAILESWKKAAI